MFYYIYNYINFWFIFVFHRPRRRSGSSIVVLGGTEDVIKSRLAVDDYLVQSGYQTDNKDLEMLTMLSVNQDNGMFYIVLTIYKSHKTIKLSIFNIFFLTF